MFKKHSFLRFIFALFLAVFIAIPAPMLASDSSDDFSEESPAEIVIPTGEENLESLDTGTQDPEEMEPQGEVTEGDDSEVDGTEVQGPEQINTDESTEVISPANTGSAFTLSQADVNHCDLTANPPSGSVYDHLNALQGQGEDVDCLDAPWVEVVPATCTINAGMTDNVISNWAGDYNLTWMEGEQAGNLRENPNAPYHDNDNKIHPDVLAANPWSNTFPIVLSPGESITITVFMQGPENDLAWPQFIGTEDAAWTVWYGTGFEYTLECPPIPQVPDPGLPTPIEPAVCQASHAGFTKMTINGVPDDGRIKIPNQENGEINADGWNTTMRFYGATREPLNDVTLTWTAVAGGNFTTMDGTVNNPGVGGLSGPNGAGFDVPVVNPVISHDGNTVTVTIDSMPANSSFSFNMMVAFDEGQESMYVHSWMLGDLVDCEPATLDMPGITPSVCNDAYQPTPIQVTAPEDSESVTYSEVTSVSGADGITFTITAEPNRGFTFEGITPTEGWEVVNNGLATYSITLVPAECEVPLKVVTPELPTLVPAMCSDANEPVLPTLTVPETEGITYSEVTTSPANSVRLSLKATANEGYTFAGATLPQGWTLVNSSEAVYEIIAEEAECPTPDPTETPTPDPTQPATPEPTETPKPEDPKEKDPEVTELPTTGTGSNPASMIGLAATAAAAIAGAGLFFTNRKR